MTPAFTIILIIIILILIIVGLALWVASSYNRMVQGRNLVEQSWNQIDVELNRRYDLIPNLVNTIKGATGYEQTTLANVVALRNQAAALAGAHANPDQRAKVEEQLTGQLQNLVALTVEAYPDLKANAGFVQLQQELSEIESRIANARKYYNANVGAYNTLIESFPNTLFTGMGHFVRADYFQIQDPGVRQNPVVDFGAAGAAGTGASTPAFPAPSAPLGLPSTGSPSAMPSSANIPTVGYTPAPDNVSASGYIPAPGYVPAPDADAHYTQPDFTQRSGQSDQR